MKKWSKNKFSALLALAILGILYISARLPSMDASELVSLADQFRFQTAVLNIEESNIKTIRKVNPAYKAIDAWISSVGAAISFTDLDNNGRFDDLILTEVRTNKVYRINNDLETVGTFDVDQLPYDAITMAPMGTLSHDFNEDGEMDVLVYYWGRSPVLFLQEDGGFEEKELVAPYQNWFSNAATLADVNGDGHADIMIGNYFPDHAAVLDPMNTKPQSMQHSMSRADNGGKNRLFVWDWEAQNGFAEDRDWLEDLEYPEDWTLAMAAADINGDLLPDIYVSNDFGPDKLLLNHSDGEKISFKQLKGKRGFTDMASCVLGKDSFKGMGAEFSDINGDGFLDIYVSNIADEYALEESHFLFIHNGSYDVDGNVAPYSNASEQLGLSRSSWGWDCKFADFNNDGIKEAIQATGFVKGHTDRWPELHEVAMGNDELLAFPGLWHRISSGDDLSGYEPNPFFVRNAAGHYFDISAQLGIDHRQVTRGLAISDYDHDGDLDFAAANQWEPSRLYINELEGNKSFLGLNIYQSLTNIETTVGERTLGYPAIGCQVRILSINGTELGQNEQLVAYVDGGNGHSGVNSKEVYFGFPELKFDDRIEVELRWRDRQGEVLEEILTLNPGWHFVNLKSNNHAEQ